MLIEYKTKEELQELPDLTDKDLNEWYQRLRKANDNFYVNEVKVTLRRPFSWRHPFRSRKETVIKYEVLEHLGGPETRVLCFPEFRTMVDATELKTWMYGFLDGVNLTLEKMEEHLPKPKFSVGDLVKVVDADTMKKARKENGWAISLGAEKYCGCQFAVYNVKYSYAQQTYTYEIGQWGHNVVWFREELLELYKKVEEPVSEYIMSKGEQERLRKQVTEASEKAELIKSGFIEPDAKIDKPLSEVLNKLSRETLDKVQEILSSPPANLGVSSNGLPNGMLTYKDKENQP